MIKDNPTSTAEQMADGLSLTPRAVEKMLASLKKMNKITRIGPAKGGHWEIINL